jgi:two-component system, OmpR family, sensor histidine kinase VicK
LTVSPLHFTEDKREVTRVFYGVETVISTVIQFLNQTNFVIYACVDQTRPILTLDILVLKNAFLDAKNRGVKLLYITEITKDNLTYCKQLMEMTHELRHLDGIKGNFYISESGYVAPASFHEEGKSASHIIYSNFKEMIDNQKYVFESFWSRGIPAKYRIRELEEGIDPVKTDLIQNPQKTLELFLNLIKSAQREILLIIPTINAFLREERIGAIKLLKQAAIERNVKVRIIGPSNKIIENELLVEGNRLKEKQDDGKNQQLEHIQYNDVRFEQTAVTTVTILVIDRKESLAIEKTDDSKLDFVKAIGLSTYSNSEPTVMSYVSIFEGLSMQADLNEQLKAHSLMQKEFINIAAHELRTPTQAITGYSELLATEPENGRMYVTPILRNSRRLQRLTEDILDVTRIESQTLKLSKEEFDLSDVILSIIGDYRSLLVDSEDNISLNIVYEPNSIRLYADKERVSQVISNLLSNAFKFTTKGTIRVTAERKGFETIVRVMDTGQGIDPELFPKLFTKFTTKSSSGTGLGLFISKSIIEAHGGRIWAENNSDGIGATFSFTLPIPQNKERE